MSFDNDMDDDFMDVLVAGFAMRIVQSLYKKSRECDCSECRPKPPQQAVIPDCAGLIFSLLKTNGFNSLTPIPVLPPSNTVTIFAGEYADRYGILYQGQFSPCSCCVLVQTTSGVVKVRRTHCNIHR
jgi:hypothetical protein